MDKRAILLIAAFWVLATTFAQEWTVPAEKESMRSPFKFDAASVAEGSNLYRLNCKSCHGTPGRADFAALVPIPGDPASGKHQDNSDGALFHKISEGRGLMPAFRSVLGARDLWSIISYLRSFKEGYVQIVSEAAGIAGSASEANILFRLEDEGRVVKLTITDSDKKPLSNVGVRLFAERTFGHLSLSDEVITSMAGEVAISIPDDLAGDKDGNVKIIAKLAADPGQDPVMADTTLLAGRAVNLPGLTEQRAMWNVGSKAPIWLMATYILGALAAWGFIVYILLGLRKIWYAGEEKAAN